MLFLLVSSIVTLGSVFVLKSKLEHKVANIFARLLNLANIVARLLNGVNEVKDISPHTASQASPLLSLYLLGIN